MKNLSFTLGALLGVVLLIILLLLLYVAFGALSMEWNMQMKVKLAAVAVESPSPASISTDCLLEDSSVEQPTPLFEAPVYHGPVVPVYPVREKGDTRKRKPLVASAEDVLLWLHDERFFAPDAIKGVQPRVVAAKKHLAQQFTAGTIVRRLTPEQITALAIRESQFWNAKDPEGLYVDLNCLGDTGYVGDEQAHGPLQISKRAHTAVSAVKGFGLRSTDFLGDLALSEMVYQAWVDQWLPAQETSELTFEWAARYWNGGPTGSRGKYFNKALRYWNGTSARAGVKGFYTQVTSLPVYAQITSFKKDGSVADVRFTPEMPDTNGLLPDAWRFKWYGTSPIETTLFPKTCVSWAAEQYELP